MVYTAVDCEHAEKAVKAFEGRVRGELAQAIAKITDDLDMLLESYAYPAED